MPSRVRKVEKHTASLPIYPPEKGMSEVTEVWFDGERFANLVEATSWTEDEFQVEVCHCGIEGCEYGGYVRLRKLDQGIVFLPCFEEMMSADELEQLMFAPPRWLQKHGIPMLGDDPLSQLRAIVPDLPDEPPAVTIREMAHLIRFEAPRNVFRNTADGPRLSPEAFIATTVDLKLREVTEALGDLWVELSYRHSPLRVRPPRETDQLITLILDGPPFKEWSPAVLTDVGICFFVGDCVVKA